MSFQDMFEARRRTRRASEGTDHAVLGVEGVALLGVVLLGVLRLARERRGDGVQERFVMRVIVVVVVAGEAWRWGELEGEEDGEREVERDDDVGGGDGAIVLVELMTETEYWKLSTRTVMLRDRTQEGEDGSLASRLTEYGNVGSSSDSKADDEVIYDWKYTNSTSAA